MFKLSILTPERKVVVDQEITEVVVPTHSGEVDILPGHVPMIANLGTGVLKYKLNGASAIQKVLISSGYCEVSPEGVNILAELVQLKEELTQDKVTQIIKANESKIVTESLNDDDYNKAQNELAKARAGLQLLN